MVLKRVIPVLQLDGTVLVKTNKFKNPQYIGDPINTLRIFNELEVDEIAVLDIRATLENRGPNYEILQTLTDECFMPLAYGGGITDVNQARRILSMGYEKIILNSAPFYNGSIVEDLAREFGSQAVVVALDFKKTFLSRRKRLTIRSGRSKIQEELVEYAIRMEELGAGELMITDIDREGTWSGLNIEDTLKIAAAVNVPIIINGGAQNVNDVNTALSYDSISAVGLGNMVVYQGQNLGVLINFPDQQDLKLDYKL